jgi:hypothetical protein
MKTKLKAAAHKILQLTDQNTTLHKALKKTKEVHTIVSLSLF